MKCSWFIVLSSWFIVNVSVVGAVFDPLSTPNNKFGVHILDTPEIAEAAKLVNSHGGAWGYVTIPIRSNDRDRDKWTKFFESARRDKVIPILRLATYPEGSNWVKPTVYDLVDFANFLSDMPWPTQNRYLILFNEPNHANEWGGEVNPSEYATILVSAQQIFKDRSTNFFLLSAGLDMSAPNSATSMEALEFYRRMNLYQPAWQKVVDGLSVHAYPNPGFSASPYSTSRFGILSYRLETNFLRNTKPIFITETGTTWRDSFWPAAFAQWSDPKIVAVTPFVLMAGTGDFTKFSLLDVNASPTQNYFDIFNLPKIAGSPLLANISLQPMPQKATFSSEISPGTKVWSWLFSFFQKKTLVQKLKIKDTTLNIEIMDTEAKQSQGLSGRANLPADAGMLFVFDKPDHYAFWMKDMQFCLDFIWIREQRVIFLSTNVCNPSTLYPPMPVDQVLEVNAGFVQQNHIAVGDKIDRWEATESGQ